MYSDQMIWLYNRDMYQKAGLNPDGPQITWDELFAATPKFQAQGVQASAAPWLTAIYGNFYWTIFWNSLGKPALSDDRTQVLFNNDDGLLSFQTIANGFKAGFWDPNAVSLGSEAETQKLFNSGKVATHMGWGIYYKQAKSGNVKDFNATISPDVVGAQLLPGIKASTSGDVEGSEGLGVIKFSQHQDAAIHFLSFVTSAAQEKAVFQDPTAGQGGSIPARTSVLNDPDVVKIFQIGKLWAEQGKWPHDLHSSPYDVAPVLDAAIQGMYKGTLTPDKALAQATAGVNDLITKYLTQ
jgi:ABC-type glycerol-3-phosphate transport system substrate-binding protein